MIPFPEYPRPALRRDSFLNLNGSWSYAITADEALPHAWDGEILVPYSPETAASGVRRTLQPNQWLHYQRMFTLPDGVGGRVLLHFGAVAAQWVGSVQWQLDGLPADVELPEGHAIAALCRI